ncbi:MAG: hypothetical protein ABIP51_18065 [Bacteroidia bacterium]
MSDFLNPVGARNPSQVSGEGGKVSESEEVYVEGAEYIPLPSKGVFYVSNPVYHNLDKLKVRQLNYTDEDILTTKSYLEDGSVFVEVLKNTIVDENNFPAAGLVPVDRDTILLWLRSTSFGNIFEAETNCPNCGNKHNLEWDISKFKIPEYDPETYEMIKTDGEYIFKTPVKELTVRISVPTIGRAKEFEKALAVKKKNSNNKTDLFGTGSIMLIINGVDDLETGKTLRKKSEIESYFNKIKLPLSDARYIRKQLDKISLAYDTKIDKTCKECEYTQEGIEMPMLHPNFFWPDAGV